MRVVLDFMLWRGFKVDKRNVPVSYPGVYLLTHEASGRHYVGSSFDLKRRLTDHAFLASGQGGTGHESKINIALRTYGAGAFRATPLYYLYSLRQDLVSQQLADAEHALIECYDCILCGFNTFATTLRAAWQDQNFRQHVAASRKTPTALVNRAAVFSSAEFKAKVSATSQVTWADPERRANASIQSTASWADPERRAAQSARLSAYLATEEGRAQRSASATEANARPEVRAKHSENTSALVWITDGTQATRIKIGAAIPEGWRLGRKPGNYGPKPKERTSAHD